MATFKVDIDGRYPRRDGTLPVRIRLTHKQKKRYINTNLVVTKQDITKGFKLKNYFFIDETNKIIKRYRDICNKNATLLNQLDADKVYELIIKTEDANATKIDIIEYGKNYVEKLLKAEKIGTAKNLNCSLENLIKFFGRKKIDINEITVKTLKEWIDWINGTRAKSLYPSHIRKLHNEAKKEFNIEELGIIKIPLSPFSVVKLPKEQKTKDIDIPIEKLRELFNLKDKETIKNINNRYNFARDMFILSFCLWGTNAKDLYECTQLKDNRIIYNRAKTKNRRDDAALISIKVEKEIEYLFEKYKDKTEKRAFNFYKLYSNSETFNAAIGKGLKQIRKIINIDYLVFYSARHSFATIAINDVGIDKYTVHQMLNHVDEKMKITDRYIRKDWNNCDKANRKILDYVFK
jgi:integrase